MGTLGTALILTGISLAFVGLIGWLWREGYLHQFFNWAYKKMPVGVTRRFARYVASETQEIDNRRQAVKKTDDYYSQPQLANASDKELPINLRVANLAVGSYVSILTDEGEVNGEVDAVIIHHEQKKIRGQWSPTGDTFKFVRLSGGEWLWIRDSRLALFIEVQEIGDIELARFKAQGERFGDYQAAVERGKSPDPIQMDYDGQTYNFLDIGRSDIVPQGLLDFGRTMARFIHLQNTNGEEVVWIEERKEGPDVLMSGMFIKMHQISKII